MFKDSMVHGILQFTPSIAFRNVLHRCESRDIRCRESFSFTEEAQVLPTHAADGARVAGYRFKYSLALSSPGIKQVAFLIDVGVALARPTRGGANGFKVSATVVCKERRTGQIGDDDGPMPTASAASENPDRRSRTTTSHDEARESWDARVAFRFSPRTKCEGRRAIDKT
ncbi:hypothetical protein CQW23_35540 [Capsicum baccatum]|uniref:Uncharacterized protein n=1 Tax=Capsicum baccatum TaxID=33114 RepID=A0A2G2UVM1_CAPBA|nr:hypothetical protein CQW23_35540 [Capsicum baccatum]